MQDVEKKNHVIDEKEQEISRLKMKEKEA